ncbi:MAG: FadR/GntR family transcriptional regulator [Angustibacter sp.]
MAILSGEARQAVFAPLDDGGLRSEAVVRRVVSAVALGLLDDGQQLPSESELATLLNVSTVTLREALAKLRRMELVATRRGRGGGSFVRARADLLSDLAEARLDELGTTDLRDLGDTHAAVASAAARLAAHRASNAEIGRLRELIDRLAATRSVTEQRRIEGRFYVELAASAQSVRLTRLQMDLQLELSQLPWLPARSAKRLNQIVTSHRRVVDAIEAREVDQAGRLADEHIGMRASWVVQLSLRRARAAGERGAERAAVS